MTDLDMEYSREFEVSIHLRRQERIRELTTAMQWLQSRPYDTKVKHELSWPTSLLMTEIEENQRMNADRCAPWFDESAFQYPTTQRTPANEAT